MDFRISDLNRCDCFNIELFHSDNEKKEGVVIFSLSGEVLAVFPRGKMSYSFWNYFVYSMCIHMLLPLNDISYSKDIDRLCLSKKKKQNRSIGRKLLNEI